MNRYIDAEKLKTEIKIIQQSLENRDVRFNQVKKIRTECMIEFCKCIFSVINSLQQEQLSILDNLDEAAEESSKAVYPYEEDSIVYDRTLVNEAREYHEVGFKAGAEWREAQIPVHSGMRDAADEYSATADNKRPVDGEKYKAFIDGAKWMAEQGEFYEGKIQVSMRTGDLVAVATVPDEKYNFNDKVLVQIRKAE